MSPEKLLKAARLPVVEALDGTFRCGGDHAVYEVWYSRFQEEMVCTCKAGKGCSHTLAVELFKQKKAAVAAEKVVA